MRSRVFLNFCIEWLFTRALTLAGEKSQFEDDDITTDRTAVTTGQGNSDDGNPDGNAEGSNEKGDDDDFLDEQAIELIKLHFLADRYSVNALQRRIEESLATYGTSADRGPSFHVLEFLYSNLDGKKSKLRHFIPEYIIYTVDEVTMYE